MAVKKLTNTGERMIPEFHQRSLMYAEHLTRYMAAESIVQNKVVLDIACGSGYGSQLLAGSARKVYGVDVDPDAVAYASKVYSAKNLEYKVGDGISIPLDDAVVDVVATFETIEHIENYQAFIKEVKRVLKPDGVLLLSTPNDLEFAEGNHFHVHEFKYKELLALVKKDFKYVDSYFQGTWDYAAIGDEQFMADSAVNYVKTVNLAGLKIEKRLYFYLVCSNRKLSEKIEPIAATGAHHSDKDIIARNAEIDRLLDERMTAIRDLQQVIRNENERYAQLEKRLSRIEKSNAYKALRKVGSIGRRIKTQKGSNE